MTSKISYCGSKCETLSCFCTYPVVVAVEKEPKKRKKKYAPMQEDPGMFCVVQAAHWGHRLFQIAYDFSYTYDFKIYFTKL